MKMTSTLPAPSEMPFKCQLVSLLTFSSGDSNRHGLAVC